MSIAGLDLPIDARFGAGVRRRIELGDRALAPRVAWSYAGACTIVATLVVLGLVGRQAGDVLIASTTIALIVGIRRNRPQLSWPMWTLVAAGMCFVAAAVARSLGAAFDDPSSTEWMIADAFAFAGYLAYGAGLVGMIRARSHDRAELTDAVVVGIAGFVLAWQFLISSALDSDRISSLAQMSVVLFTVVDCAVVALACRLAFDSATRLTVHVMMLVGMVGLLIGDVASVIAVLDVADVGPLTDLGYMLAAVAIGTGALHPSVRQLHTREPATRRALPVGRAVLLASSLLLPAAVLVFANANTAVDDLPYQAAILVLAVVATYRLIESVRAQNVAADALGWQAAHDGLTGLPNRTAIVAHLDSKRAMTGSGLVIAYFDLDQFKHVNDALGHVFGDRLLVAVATRLRERLPESVVFGRVGGDEFVAVGDMDEISSHELAAYVRSALAHPFDIGGAVTSTSASVGITLSFGERDADAILRDADTAMYRAKAAGRGMYRVFSPDMRVQAERRMHTERMLRDALARGGELHAWFQPVVDLDTGELNGFEALARWTSLDGPVSPAQFIAVAEDAGLIGEVGAVILDQACAGIATARALTGRDLFVAVNVSARQLADDTIVSVVEAALARHGLPGGALCIEITESLMVTDSNIDRLHALRRLGAWIALDDFGTGYSSLSYLRRMPVTKVKIDKSFVDDVETGNTSIMSAILAMTHSLGLTCIAEGVERESQAVRLRELGCTAAQGYLWGRPAPIDEAIALLDAAGVA
jgi:diguanylate cyclase